MNFIPGFPVVSHAKLVRTPQPAKDIEKCIGIRVLSGNVFDIQRFVKERLFCSQIQSAELLLLMTLWSKTFHN